MRDGAPDLELAPLASLDGTLAVYMGKAAAGEVSERLRAAGLAVVAKDVDDVAAGPRELRA